jgi:hypothetical protein
MPVKPNKKPVEPRKVSKATLDKARKKKLEKELDKLWSEIVRKGGQHKCQWPGCENAGNQPHHFFHKAQGNVARWEPDNGVNLCFAHHIYQVHSKGDTEPLRDYLIWKLGADRFENMKWEVRQSWKPTIDELEAKRAQRNRSSFPCSSGSKKVQTNK